VDPLGAACLCAGEVLASGAVRYTLEREIYLGPLPGQDVTPAQTLVHTLRLAGLQAVYSERIHALAWSKCVGWLACTTLAVLTRLQTYQFLSNPHTARISARVMREAGQLAAALGAPWKIALRLGCRGFRRPGGGRLARHRGKSARAHPADAPVGSTRCGVWPTPRGRGDARVYTLGGQLTAAQQHKFAQVDAPRRRFVAQIPWDLEAPAPPTGRTDARAHLCRATTPAHRGEAQGGPECTLLVWEWQEV